MAVFGNSCSAFEITVENRFFLRAKSLQSLLLSLSLVAAIVQYLNEFQNMGPTRPVIRR
jgi:hypothetical protein